MEKTGKLPMIIHGVQCIVLVGSSQDIFSQNILVVFDHDDRKRGDGNLWCGLPGGGIEPYDKYPKRGIRRELFEEIALTATRRSLEKVGVFKKLRPNGFKNKNHLFVVMLDCAPDCVTNDPAEVSKVQILELREILDLANKGMVHEGSIRLLFHFLNGTKSGLLNEPVAWQDFIF